MIKAIIFDLWNTLIYDRSDAQPSARFVELFRRKGIKDPHAFMDQNLCKRPFSSIREAAGHIARESGADRDEVERIFRGYSRLEPTPFPDVIPALERLRKAYRLAVLSNMGTFGLEQVRRTGIESLFDFRFYSFQMGMIKQEPRTFPQVLDAMGLEPSEAVMVGDAKFADIDPAERIGIRGVLMKREGFPLHYRESETHERTIRTLDELDRFLRP